MIRTNLKIPPAVEVLMNRYDQALELFVRRDLPQWDRTQQALRAFAKLPLDELPPEWDRRIDLTFRRVNAVLARYDIATFEDYQKIGSDDLDLLQEIVLGLPEA